MASWSERGPSAAGCCWRVPIEANPNMANDRRLSRLGVPKRTLSHDVGLRLRPQHDRPRRSLLGLPVHRLPSHQARLLRDGWASRLPLTTRFLPAPLVVCLDVSDPGVVIDRYVQEGVADLAPTLHLCPPIRRTPIWGSLVLFALDDGSITRPHLVGLSVTLGRVSRDPLLRPRNEG